MEKTPSRIGSIRRFSPFHQALSNGLNDPSTVHHAFRFHSAFIPRSLFNRSLGHHPRDLSVKTFKPCSDDPNAVFPTVLDRPLKAAYLYQFDLWAIPQATIGYTFSSEAFGSALIWISRIILQSKVIDARRPCTSGGEPELPGFPAEASGCGYSGYGNQHHRITSDSQLIDLTPPARTDLQFTSITTMGKQRRIRFVTGFHIFLEIACDQPAHWAEEFGRACQFES